MATAIDRFAADGEISAQTKRDEEEEKAQRAKKIRIAIFSLVAYFIIGWIAYCTGLVENFSFTNATYFLMVTLTTVGYGIFVPTSQKSRLFTLFFVLFGISIVAVALVEVANFLIEQREAMVKKMQADVIKNAADTAKKRCRCSFFL